MYVLRLWKGFVFNVIFPVIRDDTCTCIYCLQHGFVKGCSTISQLLTVLQEVSCVLDSAGQVDMIYHDFSKAIDSVSHELIIHKLVFGFYSDVLVWFKSYLHNRQQRVVVEAASCVQCATGFRLGPLLYIHVNDMPSTVQNSWHCLLMILIVLIPLRIYPIVNYYRRISILCIHGVSSVICILILRSAKLFPYLGVNNW